MGRAFVDAAGTAILKNKANLLNVTIRSVEKDHDSLLRYAPEQRMAFVMLFHQRRTQAAEKAMEILTGQLIEAALKLGGTYYLPYRLHATPDQFHRVPTSEGVLQDETQVRPQRTVSKPVLPEIWWSLNGLSKPKQLARHKTLPYGGQSAVLLRPL